MLIDKCCGGNFEFIKLLSNAKEINILTLSIFFRVFGPSLGSIPAAQVN